MPHEVPIEILPGQPELEKSLSLGSGTVRVAIVSAADQMPLERAEVSLQRGNIVESPAPRQRRMMMISVDVNQDEDASSSTVTMGDGPGTVKTDEDGLAVLEDIPPGEYTLVVRHSRHVVKRVPEIVVTDGGSTDTGTLALENGGFISGRVTGLRKDGMQIALVEIRAVGSKEEPRRETAMRGTFRVDGLRPGAYQVRAQELGIDTEAVWGPPTEVTVTAGKTARIDVPLRGN